MMAPNVSKRTASLSDHEIRSSAYVYLYIPPLICHCKKQCPVLEIYVELILSNKALCLSIAANSRQTLGRVSES